MVVEGPGIVTSRLELIPCTLELAQAALAGPDAVTNLLGVDVAAGWPEEPVREFFPIYVKMLEADPTLLGWGIWVIVHHADRRVIGDIGFKGKPDGQGSVEIGYSVVSAYQSRGYATEAARALVAWALGQPDVRSVRAECEETNLASVRVLERAGLTQVASEGGILQWVVRR